MVYVVRIPSGEFWMGAEDRNRNREQAGRDNAIPGHEVRISNGFWMGKYEVTQEQWEAVMGDNPAHDFGVGNDYPVYFVSWDQIQTFEAVLDNVFRLPSEAEWEYTCRAGTVTRFYWGNDPNDSQIDDYAWYSEISENQTHSVGQLRPNYWGLYDMSGNILEWTEDGHSVNYEGAPNDGSPWNEESEWSMVRGGFWDAGSGNCIFSWRAGDARNDPVNYIGFRLVRDAD
jgi:formylglycine-generating enzyme required for sulfatase activity